ncbi:hypothetical protein FE257_004193 [Aspergillus nanangensis]|uniref:Suppressor of anucleate metulae protein B n=1 Tax=Aspergillus nanangensis TaxID=2582783 RepID=A0AAD4CRZ3_ASPNN|nr:hypothetical protein FE257_004193 [Aspergillus nanangensis]
MELDRYTTQSSERDTVDDKFQPQLGAKCEFEKQISLSDTPHGSSSRVGTKTRILRASDVLLSLTGRLTPDGGEPPAGVENFQEALRLFPPFRDDDGATLGAVDVKCPDCDAVYSSANELKQHYLSKYCPGAAVAAYVMTRDRLITKGYRMEKRLIPLDCRPLRFFCSSCERHFAFGADDERVDRERNTPSYVDCKNCGEKCNITWEPVLNDPRDDASFRDVQREMASPTHSRSPSVSNKGGIGTKLPNMGGVSEQPSLVKKARKIRDSWSFRKLSQGDDDELVAISFAGLYDLERVHAPNGKYRQIDSNAAETQTIDSSASFISSAANDDSVYDPKRSPMELCEDEHQRSDTMDSVGDSDENGNSEETPRQSRSQSFLRKLFGRKTKGLYIPFPVCFSPGSESRAAAHESARTSTDETPQVVDPQQAGSPPEGVTDTEYVALLRSSQNIFVHMQYLSGGAVIHDASGRQRILQMDEVAQLFLQLKDESTAATIWSRTVNTRLRAEAALKNGNCRAAVVEYHDALRILDSNPALDLDKLARAAMLHSLGQAYRNLDMPAESEACYLEALGLYKRTLGRDSAKNYAVLHDLGALCEKDGYATEAAALFERSFAGRLKTLGHNAPETLSSMQDLASLKVLLGDLESALLLLEKAVPALDTVFGLQNATTLHAMNQLSLLYQKLGLDKESRTICGRSIPHCRSFFGITSPITRDVVVRYLQSSDNFDFPPDIQDILDTYQRSRDPDALRVIHRLGRSYMDAGLNRDAAELFEVLVEDFLTVKGPEAPETFDALSALCVSREHLDSVDKAILAYKQLVHMATRTPEDHHSRKRISYAEKRITELNRRREILAAERKEWGLHAPGPCGNCAESTTVLCNTCKIFRFCSDLCHKTNLTTHFPSCIPSVSLRESKSLAVKPKCPSSARDQAISKIRRFNSSRPVHVTASYTFYLDPRNFSTFRMKLNSDANTIILFSLDSDIQYATIDNPPLEPESASTTLTTTPSPTGARGSISSPSTTTATGASSSSPPTPGILNPNSGVQWLSPERQEAVCYVPSEMTQPGQARYVLVTPGKDMLKSVIDKRVGVRSGNGEKERFRALELPDDELIEYAQGLLLTGYLGEAFMYVIEWVWK